MTDRVESTLAADKLSVIVAASVAYSIAVLFLLVSPALVGVLAESRSITGSELGIWVGLYALGLGIGSLSSFWWINRFAWLAASIVGMALVGVCLGLQEVLTSIEQMYVLTAMAGVGGGIASSTALAVLGAGSDPVRGFRVMILLSVLLPALIIAVIPYFAGVSGFSNGMVLLAIVSIAGCALVLPGLRAARGMAREKDEVQNVSDGETILDSRGSFFGLVAITIFAAGFVGAWSFFERIGGLSGLSIELALNALVVGQLAGGVGGYVASVLTIRFDERTVFLSSSMVIMLSLVSVEILDMAIVSFFVIVCVFQVSLNACFTLILGFISNVDRSGRYVAIIPGLQAIGSFVGAVLVGIALESFGRLGIIVSNVGFFALCTAIMILAYKQVPGFAPFRSNA